MIYNVLVALDNRNSLNRDKPAMPQIRTRAILQLWYTKHRAMRHHPKIVQAWLQKRLPAP